MGGLDRTFPPADTSLVAKREDVLVTLALVRALVASGGARRIRERAGLSLAEVGRACKTDGSTIWRWERGAVPRAEFALRYADALAALVDLGHL